MRLQFPVKGLVENTAFQGQPPYSTPDCLNVRPDDPKSGRTRGAMRPGLVQEFNGTKLAGPVRMMETVTIVKDDGFRFSTDYFDGREISDVWSTPKWLDKRPKFLPIDLSKLVYTEKEAGLVRDSLSIDTNSTYTIEIFIHPYEGEHWGEYKIFARLDNTTPDVTQDGVEATLVMTGSKGSYEGTLVDYSGGSSTSYNFSTGEVDTAEPGWFRMTINGDNIKCYWRGNSLIDQNVSSHTGKRVGFGMKCTEKGGICLIDAFRAQYFDGTKTARYRTLTIASAAGKLYKEDKLGDLKEVIDGTGINIQSDRPIEAAEWGQKLWIADYGDTKAKGDDGTVNGTDLTATSIPDWTDTSDSDLHDTIDPDNDVVVISNAQGSASNGVYKISSVSSSKVVLASSASSDSSSVSYRIERGPKVYDPKEDTLELWVSTTGIIPVGCRYVATYSDRVTLSHNFESPHVIHASRQGDPYDWDFGADGEDPQRAFATDTSTAGGTGQPVTATIPHDDDFMIVGATNSVWRISGDPTYGGRIDPLSHDIGIIPGGWCKGPQNETIFLSRDGFYIIGPGGESYPQNVSHPVLPDRLKNVDVGDPVVSMGYDVKRKGINLFITTEGKHKNLHWWFDWEQKSFWPIYFKTTGHNPTAVMYLPSESAKETGLYIGCYDGYIRRFDDGAEKDDGSPIESYVVYGPMLVNKEGYEGYVDDIVGTMAQKSRTTVCYLLSADSAEELLESSEDTFQHFSAGVNQSFRPRIRASVFGIKLYGGNGWWSIESLTVQVKRAGKRRL